MALSAALALGLTACGEDAEQDPTTGGGDAQATGTDGGEGDGGTDGAPSGTINLGVAYETTNYHPSNTSSALAMGTNWHIVEGLYEFNMEDYSVYAALAADDPVEISDTEYEVTLRDGAKFSDGSDVTAEDVVASYERVVNGEENADGERVTSIYAQFFDFVDTMEAKDDKTVTIKLNHPFGALKERLVDIKIVPASASFEELTAMPIGSGPFKYDSITPTVVEASVNEHYNGPKPAQAEKMHWDVLKDDAARLTAALGGTIDVMETVPADAIPQLEGAGWTIAEVPGYNNPFLMFNTSKSPWDDVNVRQAILYAIDTQTIIDTAMSGKAEEATSFLPASNPAYKEAAVNYSFDLDKAKELMAGTDAEGATLNLLTTDHPWISGLAPQVKQNLEALGLTVNVTSVASADVYAQTDAEGTDYDVVLAPGDPSVFGVDPGIIINWWYGDNVWTQQRNGFQASDPEAYGAIEAAIAEASQLSGDEANAKWGEVQDLISESVPLYPLFHRTMITGYNGEKLHGVEAIGTTGLELVGVSVNE